MKLRKQERARDLYYQRKYGITLKTYNRKLKKQRESCALCERHASEFKTRLAVDHNHKTGTVRGLVCYYCNKFVIGRNTATRVAKLKAYFDEYDPES